MNSHILQELVLPVYPVVPQSQIARRWMLLDVPLGFGSTEVAWRCCLAQNEACEWRRGRPCITPLLGIKLCPQKGEEHII